MQKKHLFVVAGATASGKTTLGIRMAQHFKTVILSADSRQFYREMEIGTAKPTAEELAAAPHYFINSLSIDQDYNVGQFERDGIQLIEKLHQEHDVIVMVGGSGLFIKAICEGLDHFPTVNPEIRTELMATLESNGLELLQAELKAKDPDYFEKVDIQNPQRVIRALEIIRSTGKPFSAFRTAQKVERPFSTTIITIEWERDVLYERINQRVEQMLAAGLEEEARKLYPQRALNALQTVGYQEWFDYFEGKIDRAEAVRLIKRNTRRYAKRQLTWLRKVPDLHRFSPNEMEAVIPFLEQKIRE